MTRELHHIPSRWRELQLAASASADDSTVSTQKGAVHKDGFLVKGKGEAVVQDAEAYQRLLDIAASANPAGVGGVQTGPRPRR